MIEEILSVLFVFMILLYLSWIILYFLPKKRVYDVKTHPSCAIIMPAHNEEVIIGETVRHALDAEYPGQKQVIVIDDGSTDKTPDIVRKIMGSAPNLKLLHLDHKGKANAINHALTKIDAELVLILDADSRLAGDAVLKMLAPFADPDVGAVSGVIRVIVNNNPLVWYQDIEYLLSSTWRRICDKLDATYLLPGFTAFRRQVLKEVGGFKTDTLSEDFEIGLRLRKAGYKMIMADAIMFTHVPQTFKALARQRMRWGRGTIQVVKKHSDVPFNPEYGAIGFYGIPTQLYWFIHGFIAFPITMYQLFNGYLIYFAKYEDYISYNVLKYFFGWISLSGMIEYSYNTITGVYPMTSVFILCFTSFILGMSYNLLSIIRYSRLNIRHLFVIFFNFPYSIFALIVFTFPILLEFNPLGRKKDLVNVWDK
ncbi:glycosyltransferase [Candidatus Altiarchaeota archaeon]